MLVSRVSSAPGVISCIAEWVFLHEQECTLLCLCGVTKTLDTIFCTLIMTRKASLKGAAPLVLDIHSGVSKLSAVNQSTKCFHVVMDLWRFTVNF